MKKETVKKVQVEDDEDEVSKMIKEAIAQDPEFVQENVAFMERLVEGSDKPASKLSVEKPPSSPPVPRVKPKFKPIQYKPRQRPAKVVIEEVDDGIPPVVENIDALVRDISARVRSAPRKEVDALRSVREKREAERTQEIYEILEDFFVSVERLVRELTKVESSIDVNRATREIFAGAVRTMSGIRVDGKRVLPSNMKPRIYGKIPVFKDLIKDCLIRCEKGQGMSRTDVLAKIGRDHRMYRKLADSVFLQLVEEEFLVKRRKRYYLKKKETSMGGKG